MISQHESGVFEGETREALKNIRQRLLRIEVVGGSLIAGALTYLVSRFIDLIPMLPPQ